MVIEADVIHVSGGFEGLFQETVPQVVAMQSRRIARVVRQQTTFSITPANGSLLLEQVSRTPRLNAPMIVAEQKNTLPSASTAYIEIRSTRVKLHIETPSKN